MVYTHLSLSSLLLLAFVQGSLQQACYYPDGSVAKGDTPCTNMVAPGVNVILPCCGPGRGCLGNRMCSGNNVDSNPTRGSCTDQTWKSDNCPQFCTKPLSTMGAPIANCYLGAQDTVKHYYYCCAQDGPKCCNDKNLLFIADAWDFASSRPESSAAASSAAASSMTSSTSSLSSSSPTTTSTPSSSSTSSAQSTTDPSSTSSTPSSSSSSTPSSSPSNLSSSRTSSPSTSSPSTSSQSTSSPNTSSTLSSSTTETKSAATASGSRTDVSTTSTPTSPTVISTKATEPHSDAKRDWTGLGIGVGVGISIPLLVLALVGPMLWRRHRRRIFRGMISPVIYPHDSASSRSASTRKEPLSRTGKPAPLYEVDGAPGYELDALGGRVELSTKSPRELPGAEGERQRYVAYRPSSH